MITASIVTYNHHVLDFEPVLRSLFASPVDVIYIIDHSADLMPHLQNEIEEYRKSVIMKDKEMKKRLDDGLQLVYIAHENNGYGGGHNCGIRRSVELGAEYHLVVNPDIWFGPEVIPSLASYMDEHKEVGQMMPKVLYPDGEVQRLCKLLPTPLDMFGRMCLPGSLVRKRNARFELIPTDFTVTMNVPYLSGCFMFFRVSALKDVNMFDENLFMYAEDIDITRRIHRHYSTLFFPEVCVYHKFNRASHREFRLFYIHVTNIIMYFNKWGWWKDAERSEFNNRLITELRAQGIEI